MKLPETIRNARSVLARRIDDDWNQKRPVIRHVAHPLNGDTPFTPEVGLGTLIGLS